MLLARCCFFALQFSETGEREITYVLRYRQLLLRVQTVRLQLGASRVANVRAGSARGGTLHRGGLELSHLVEIQILLWIHGVHAVDVGRRVCLVEHGLGDPAVATPLAPLSLVVVEGSVDAPLLALPHG